MARRGRYGLAFRVALAGIAAGACEAGSASAEDGATTSVGDSTVAVDGSSTGAGGLPDGAHDEVFGRLPGLWTATQSTIFASDRPGTTMDIRPADDRTLFGHADVFRDHVLRFAFSREMHHSDVVLVFRDFEHVGGVQADVRGELVEADLEQERFRWCAIAGGCASMDALLDFDGPDALELEVTVDASVRLHWAPQRVESRPVDPPFPADDQANPPDAPFPTLPTLQATLSWADPLTEPADVWIVLATTWCTIPPGCTFNRFVSGEAPTGATELVLEIERIHPGDYFVNTILDRDRNVDAGLHHDPGDAASLSDRMVTIAEQGVTETSIPIDIEY